MQYNKKNFTQRSFAKNILLNLHTKAYKNVLATIEKKGK